MSEHRRHEAHRVRALAADLAREREHPQHEANGDEHRYAKLHYFMSFTKGLPHDTTTGLLEDPEHFEAFRTAVDLGGIDRFTARVPLGPSSGSYIDTTEAVEPRQWEAPTAGVVYSLQGPDAQALTMPPAPPLLLGGDANPELVFEMAEVYELALLRDTNFAEFEDGGTDNGLQDSIGRLNKSAYVEQEFPGRPRPNTAGQLDRQTVFRDTSVGSATGPYLSQLLILGNTGRDRDGSVADGLIQYGSLQVLQHVDVATPGVDFMQSWDRYIDVQNGAMGPGNTYLLENKDGQERVKRRPILTPRDLATYVHFDALYEAYLNACLILLEMGTPFDPGFANLSGSRPLPDGTTPTPQTGTRRHAAGFALFGGPHILTLVTEVATRALRAVRYQKFNNHMRLRPEALAARVALATDEDRRTQGPPISIYMESFAESLDDLGTLEAIRLRNGGSTAPALLPMAFSEGSPMHPSYGAGHATVAGACVTVLKAFFDTGTILGNRGTNGTADIGFFCPRRHQSLRPIAFRTEPADNNGARVVPATSSPPLTLEGELNKLASNIAIGRNMAGVHFFSDDWDSLRLGERIAIGMLEEQALTYPIDPFVLSVPLFDGGVVRIGNR